MNASILILAAALAAGPALGAGPDAEAPVASPQVVAPTDPQLGDTATSGAPLSVEDLLGMPVLGADGMRLGTVEDVVVDDDGQPAELVVDTGGAGRIVLEADAVEMASADALRIGHLSLEEVEAIQAAEDEDETSVVAMSRRRVPMPLR